MVGCASGGEQVKGNAKVLPRLEKIAVVAGGYFRRILAFLFCLDGYGRAVLVRARNHQHFIAFEVVVAGKDVCGEIGAGNLPQMQGAIGIRPGYTNKNSFTHINDAKVLIIR